MFIPRSSYTYLHIPRASHDHLPAVLAEARGISTTRLRRLFDANMFPLLHQRGLLEVQEKLQGEGYVVIVESRSNSQWILFTYLIAEFGRRWPGIASSLS